MRFAPYYTLIQMISMRRAISIIPGRIARNGISSRGLAAVARAHDDPPQPITYDAVPGLMLLPDFLTESEAELVTAAARRLSQQAAVSAVGQAGTVSTAHNVNQREEFVRVELREDQAPGAVMNAEHFSNYGEGHNLTYFRGKLPTFALGERGLSDRLAALPAVIGDSA